MRKILDYVSWGFVLLFAAPSLLIMGSWSSLPGDFMYPVKIGLEGMLLFVAKPSYAAEASLNVKYTERRLTETKVLLSNDQSGKGLSYLTQQVIATKAVIDRAPNTETRRQLSRKYVATLETVSLELSKERKQIAAATSPQNSALEPTQRPSIFRPTDTPPPLFPTGIHAPIESTVTPIESNSTPISYPSPTNTPEENANNNTVITEIDTTQDQIQETINDLNKSSLLQDQLENLQNNQDGQNNQNQEQNNSQDFRNGNNNNNNDNNNSDNHN